MSGFFDAGLEAFMSTPGADALRGFNVCLVKDMIEAYISKGAMWNRSDVMVTELSRAMGIVEMNDEDRKCFEIIYRDDINRAIGESHLNFLRWLCHTLINRRPNGDLSRQAYERYKELFNFRGSYDQRCERIRVLSLESEINAYVHEVMGETHELVSKALHSLIDDLSDVHSLANMARLIINSHDTDKWKSTIAEHWYGPEYVCRTQYKHIREEVLTEHFATMEISDQIAMFVSQSCIEFDVVLKVNRRPAVNDCHKIRGRYEYIFAKGLATLARSIVINDEDDCVKDSCY